MDRRVREKSPSWVPKKLRMLAQACKLKRSRDGIPSHHNADPLDLLEVDGLCIVLQSATICCVEACERNKDRAIVGMTWLCLRRKLKVTLIGDGSLLAARVWVGRQQCILQIQSIPFLCSMVSDIVARHQRKLTISLRRVQLDSSVF